MLSRVFSEESFFTPEIFRSNLSKQKFKRMPGGKMKPQVESQNLKEFNEKTFVDEADFVDKNLLCIDCGDDFIWSVGEQTFFRDKGLTNPPKRCKKCKQAKNERLAAITAAQNAGIKQRIEVAVHCAKCQSYTTVPFYPSQGRPVFCRSCYLEKHPDLINGNGSKER
jgi:CxxC-x17-CxxC domain-containing protein